MAADEIGEFGHVGSLGDVEPVAEIVPEADAELGAGVHQTEECIAAIAAGAAVGTAADLALDDLAADVALRAVGVQRNVRPVEHHQQVGLVGMQPRQQAIEHGEAGAAGEDAVEAGTHLAAAAGARVKPVGLQVGVETTRSARACAAGRRGAGR